MTRPTPSLIDCHVLKAWCPQSCAMIHRPVPTVPCTGSTDGEITVCSDVTSRTEEISCTTTLTKIALLMPWLGERMYLADPV